MFACDRVTALVRDPGLSRPGSLIIGQRRQRRAVKQKRVA
jgi:hypothetical protein